MRSKSRGPIDTPPNIRLEEIFEHAAALPAAERAAWLDEACAGQPELRAEVEELLRSHEAGGFMKGAPRRPDIEAELARLKPEEAGERIGNYKLLEQIGEGGFGVVWVAEQEKPMRRRVALKIIKLGMDTKGVVARFEQERQALAMMDHPNIAKVLDAGATPFGRPFFVMELVRGIKITEYCDQANLSTADRLELFIAVCQAVQHAHQKGIIHRDLKPSNILVTLHDGVPVPKVIDFGVAKATQQRLTDLTIYTQFEQMIGTPLYMSPEQAEMSALDVDTRSDIYSLGVLLYELLVGRTPFDPEELMKQGLDEIRRTIREQEPPKPSTALQTMAAELRTNVAQHRQLDAASIAKLLRGDLDWIVMKALEKDRSRRYETANGFAADLRRHLENQPVIARPPSAAYRFHKAFRRNKLAFAAAAMVGLVLVAGVIVSSWQAFEASRARNAEKGQRLAAQTERDKAQTAKHEAEQQTQRALAALTRLEIERAESMFEVDSPARGIAYLARLLRQAPTNRVVAERLLSALSSRNFCLPSAPPLRHSAKVNCAHFSPDGQWIVTASLDGTAQVWDSRLGQPAGEALRHGGEIKWAQFSPDSRRIVTASVDGTARVWNAHTGKAIGQALRHDGAVLFADFSPDGRRVVTGSQDKTLRLWDAETGEPVLPPILNEAEVYFVQFSPNGNELVGAINNGMSRVISCADGTEVASFPHHRQPDSAIPFPQYSPNGERLVTLQPGDAVVWDIRGKRASAVHLPHRHNPTSATFSPDGKLVATGSLDNTARIWDARTGQLGAPPLKHDDVVYAVQFSTDGTLLLTSSADKTVGVWDVRTGKPVTLPLQHGSRVKSVRFSGDSRQVLAVTDGNEAVIWRVRLAVPPSLVLKHGYDVRHAVFSRDGQRVATASWDRTARVWDVRTGSPVTASLKQLGLVNFVRFSPDGQRVATVSDKREIRIWNAATGEPLLKPDRLGSHIYNLNFSPDGRSIVMATDTNGALVWDTASGESISHPAPTSNVRYALFSPEGQRVLTASADKTARIWDARTGRPLTEPLRHDETVTWAEFSPDGKRVVTASRDKTARIWDANNGKMLTKPLIHADALGPDHSVQFSPDGRWVVTAAGDAVQVWDAHTGEPVTPRLEHSSRVTSVRFSPDGKRLITATFAGPARIWDAATGYAVSEPLRHREGCHYAEFSPDGEFVVTASADGTAAIWWVALPPTPIPAWLPDLAEALAGRKIDDAGNSVVVPVENLFRLKQRLAGSSERESSRPKKQPPAARVETPATGVASDEPLADGGASNYFAAWTQWFFADSLDRALFPLSASGLRGSRGR